MRLLKCIIMQYVVFEYKMICMCSVILKKVLCFLMHIQYAFIYFCSLYRHYIFHFFIHVIESSFIVLLYPLTMCVLFYSIYSLIFYYILVYFTDMLLYFLLSYFLFSSPPYVFQDSRHETACAAVKPYERSVLHR